MEVQALRFLLLLFAGLVNRRQAEVIEYLKPESRVIREQLAGGRLRFIDNQRRSLPSKGKLIARKALRDVRSIVHDRDPLFTREFRDMLAANGTECLKLPARSPNLNAYAERFVLSIKSECLNKVVPLGQNHLPSSSPSLLVLRLLSRHRTRVHTSTRNGPAAQPPDNDVAGETSFE